MIDATTFNVAGACASPHAVAVQLPALSSIGTLSVASTTTPCAIAFSAPKLATAFSAGFGSGVTSVTLGVPLTVTTVLQFVSTNITALSLPQLSADILQINTNASLVTVSGGGGQVTNRIIIQNNPLLPTGLAISFANSFNPHGNLFISGNG
ncbi:MAG: hypothetical protein U0163_07920 [Gemmatimonadaceae bacterium]